MHSSRALSGRVRSEARGETAPSSGGGAASSLISTRVATGVWCACSCTRSNTNGGAAEEAPPDGQNNGQTHPREDGRARRHFHYLLSHSVTTNDTLTAHGSYRL